MSTKLGVIVADFSTQLATKISAAGTSVSLQSATDDDGVSLPAGNYFFTIDGANSAKEHIFGALSGVNITSIQSVSRQGVFTSGVAREHRVGASVSITDHGHLLAIRNLFSGTAILDATIPLGYDGAITLTSPNQLTTKTYVDSFRISRVVTTASTATLTPNCDTYDFYTITAQSGALVIANNSGTPTEGKVQIVRILDDGTARAITYGTDYREIGTALPSTTVQNKIMYLFFVWNATDNKWDFLGKCQQS